MGWLVMRYARCVGVGVLVLGRWVRLARDGYWANLSRPVDPDLVVRKVRKLEGVKCAGVEALAVCTDSARKDMGAFVVLWASPSTVGHYRHSQGQLRNLAW